MKNPETRAAAAERLLAREGMPPELPMDECDCLVECDRFIDSTQSNLSNLQSILADADLSMEDLVDAVSRDPDNFIDWIHANGGFLH